jgi:hypothetical protein
VLVHGVPQFCFGGLNGGISHPEPVKTGNRGKPVLVLQLLIDGRHTGFVPTGAKTVVISSGLQVRELKISFTTGKKIARY